MGKRKGSALEAAFAKANQAAAGQKLAPLEANASETNIVPEEYLSEVTKQYEQYRDEQATVCRLARNKAAVLAAQLQQQSTRNRAAAAAAAASGLDEEASDADDLDLDECCIGAAAADNSQTVFSRWQAKADYCVRQLSVWAGSSIVLQQALQEQLLHILVNADLHTDPLLSVQAYRLLQQNLQAHPPATSKVLSEAQPPVLLQNCTFWHPMADATSKALTDMALSGKSKFSLLQDLVYNAGHIVTGSYSAVSAAGSSSSSSSSSKPSQGKALLLLYLTQVLQADCLVRLAVFEQHLQATQASQSSQQDERQARVRAAVLLQHSFLWRLLEHDGSWALADSLRGKHHLVRELLRIIASNGGSSTDDVPNAAAAAAAAVDSTLPPVSAQELVLAARRLLLLLLQLYSNAEAAGLYGNSDRSSHHAQRGLAARANDRYELDEVLRQAMSGTWMLPELQEPAALMRVLQLLPPVHRARIVAIVVAGAVANRPYDDPVPPNAHLLSLYDYTVDRGRGFGAFRAGDPLEVIRAVSDRLEWAAKELLGGKEAFAVMVCCLVSAAVPGKLVSQAERQEFDKLARGVLNHVMDNNRARLFKAHDGGCCNEVVMALAVALQNVGAVLM